MSTVTEIQIRSRVAEQAVHRLAGQLQDVARLLTPYAFDLCVDQSLLRHLPRRQYYEVQSWRRLARRRVNEALYGTPLLIGTERRSHTTITP